MKTHGKPPGAAPKSELLEGHSLKGLSAEAARALAHEGVPTYRVVGVEPTGERDSSRPSESRAQRRARTRLRSAKVIDAANVFVCDAIIQDRSSDGMRLLLARNVGLPGRFGVYDDECAQIVTVVLAWRRDRAVGLRIQRRGPPAPMKRSEELALSTRYYGVRD